MSVSLPDLFHKKKVVASRLKWRKRDSTRVEFAAPLAIDGSVFEGLELRGKAIVDMPERAVCFNLLYYPTNSRCRQLCRIEWNPLRAHINPLKGNDRLNGKRLDRVSHIHDFDDNWLPEFNRMRLKNLPFAARLDPNPSSFQELLDLVEERLRIEGLRGMEPPPWSEGTLFGG